MSKIRKRWRPSIALVVSGVCITLVSVPLLALLVVRLTSNQFVRETEQSLIQQSAIYAELFADAFLALPGEPVGQPLDEARKAHWGADLHPVRATLNVRVDPVMEARPDGAPVDTPVNPRHAAITEALVGIARQAQKTNLSAVAFLTHDGRLLNETGAPSLSALPEVQAALAGDIGRALRFRGKAFEAHPLASISRDTVFRVFVAYPVIGGDRVLGAIYMSRTPLNLGKFLFQERSAILTMLGAMFVAAAMVGWVMTRLISRPTKGLRDAAMSIADGDLDHTTVLSHYGLRELATLGESVEEMAATLTTRSKEITTYTDHVTHELKSPVTSIVGAAELLQSEHLSGDDRSKLLRNIADEAQRMNTLLGSLRQLTRMKTMTAGKPGKLGEMIPQISGLEVLINGDLDAKLPLTLEHGQIILLHIAQNAHAHNATFLRIDWDGQKLTLTDDGDGIAASDISRVKEPFFTTRREHGGTGMGLAICDAVLAGCGAVLGVHPNDGGAVFGITFSTKDTAFRSDRAE